MSVTIFPETASRFIPIGGVLTSPPAASYNQPAGTVVVTVRGTDGYLYRLTAAWSAHGPTWTGFVRYGSTKVSSAASVAARSSRYNYRGTDDALWYLDSSTDALAPHRVGGMITSTPFALDVGTGENENVQVFARGSDGHLYMYNAVADTFSNLGGGISG
jgi:hypothetical protein